MGNRSLIIALVFFVLLRACTTETPPSPPSTTTANPVGLATRADTPVPLTFQTTVIQPTYCYNGPADNYPGRTIVAANIVVDVLGTTNGTMDWFMVQAPSIGRCWIQAGMLSTNIINVDQVLKFTDVRTTQDAVCYLGPGQAYSVQTVIPVNWRIVVYGKNDIGDWILVVPHDSTQQCWVFRTTLYDFDSSPIPVELAPTLVNIAPTSPFSTPTPTLPSPPTVTPTLPSLVINWKMISYDCNNTGKATGILIDLDVSGGQSPYSFSPGMPMYAQPGQAVSVTIRSSTADGEPSAIFGFPLPNAADPIFRCDQPGSKPGPATKVPTPTNAPPPPPPTPTDPPPPPPTPTDPPPPTPTLCWPPGKCK